MNRTGRLHLRFLKTKIADGRHLQKSKNGHVSATVQLISTKFSTVMHINHRNRTGSNKILLLKIQDGRHLKKMSPVKIGPCNVAFCQNYLATYLLLLLI